MDTNTRSTFLALVLLIVTGALVYSVWSAILQRVDRNNPKVIVCTADAMQCPDGSWVGRSGPNCTFACPGGTDAGSNKEATFQTKIGESSGVLDVTVTPIAVVEDSRCPSGVQCIQAGTVRVQAVLVSGMGTSSPVFTIDRPITTEAETVTLVSVTPVPEAGKTIVPANYRLTFKVTKR